LALAGCSGGGANVQADADMMAANRAVVERYVDELYNHHDISHIDEILSPDFVFNGTTSRADVVKIFSEPGIRTSFSDWSMKIEDVMVDAHTVVIRNSFGGTNDGPYRGMAPTNTTCKQSGLEAFHVENGMITAAWVNTNQLEMAECLGTYKPPAQPAQ
jgi:predicted ester cyclase